MDWHNSIGTFLLCTYTMYSDFEHKIIEYSKQHRMLLQGRILVALSGGGDSVALLTVLYAIRQEFGLLIQAAHLNHMLRGKESLEDEQFCRELCHQFDVPLTVERFEHGELDKKGGSLETVARKARLAFLHRTAEHTGCIRIATGHTRDDQAETILQRILRGTGPSGLAGILPVRDNLWVRPLLCVRREEAREYLSGKNVPYRDDSSNDDEAFFRNSIRHTLLPLLIERYSPNITVTLSRLADLTRVQEDFLESTVDEAYARCINCADTCAIILDKERFMSYHKLLRQRIVRQCLKNLEGCGRDADMQEIEHILHLVESSRKTADVTANIQCSVEKKHVVLARKSPAVRPVALKIPGVTSLPMHSGIICAERVTGKVKTDGVRSVVVLLRLIENYGGLTVGSVKPGESMTLSGTDGLVKIRDILSAMSIPRVLRKTIPVVRAGAVPIWIPGIRSSHYLMTEEAVRNSGTRIFLEYSGGLFLN